MPIYKYIKTFLILPGLYITIFAFAMLYLWLVYLFIRRYFKSGSDLNRIKIVLFSGMYSCFICSLGTYAISINSVSQRIMHSLEYTYANQNITPDAIIVLGVGYGRSVMAAKLYKKHKVDIIPTGFHGQAEYMAKIMSSNGVEVKNILLEKQAANTKENVKYTLSIARARGYKKVYLVTSAYHMPRSMMNFERPFAAHGIEVVPFACEYRTPREYKPSEHDWLPDMRYFQQSAIAWNEYLGMLELWVF